VRHRLDRGHVALQAFLHLGHQRVARFVAAGQQRAHGGGRLVGLGLPARLGRDHQIGLLVGDDHVLLMARHGGHGGLELGERHCLLVGALGELVGHVRQPPHAPEAGAADGAQQDQHHGDGADHALAHGELPHESLHLVLS
jgi:hypothetical protein